MLNGDVLRRNLGLSYQKQCWSVEVRFIDEPLNNEQRYEFMINLFGIGEFGSQFSQGGGGTGQAD